MAIGTTLSGANIAPSNIPKFIPGSKKYNSLKKTWDYCRNNEGKVVYDNNTNKPKTFDLREPETSAKQKMIFTAGTTLLGAALGALVGAIKDLDQKWSQSRTNRRLSRPIEQELKRCGYKENVNYTFDPKKANEIPTRVCIVLSSASGELQTIINTKDDRELKKLVDKISRTCGNRAKSTSQNDRFNEITITTEKNASKNVKQVVSIIKSFVENNYPVYIVEVG